jgi:Tfp pilus assembly protein PilV
MKIKNCKTGFSLAEVLIALIFVGLAIAALMAGNSAFTQANFVANEMSTAEFLTEQVRERTTLLHFENLHSSFNNVTYSPPQDAKGDVLNDFAAYSQQITVENVSSFNFTQGITYNSSNKFIRVTVKIYRGTKEISSANWIRAQY